MATRPIPAHVATVALHELSALEDSHIIGRQAEPLAVLALGREPLMPIPFDPHWVVGANHMHPLRALRKLNRKFTLAPIEGVRAPNFVVASDPQKVDVAVGLFGLSRSFGRRFALCFVGRSKADGMNIGKLVLRRCIHPNPSDLLCAITQPSREHFVVREGRIHLTMHSQFACRWEAGELAGEKCQAAE